MDFARRDELRIVRCTTGEAQSQFDLEQVIQAQDRQFAKHSSGHGDPDIDSPDQPHSHSNVSPETSTTKWSSGSSFSASDKVQFRDSGGIDSSEDGSESGETTDSAEGWEEVFSRSPLTRVPASRGRAGASMDIHPSHRAPVARPHSRHTSTRRTSLDFKHRSNLNPSNQGHHTNQGHHHPHIPTHSEVQVPATPGRGRRLSLEVDWEAAVYYYGNTKEASTEATSFAASRGFLLSSSCRRSASSKHCMDEVHLPGLVFSTESAEADVTCAADIIPCVALGPTPNRARRRRRSLDIAPTCSDALFAYSGLSAARRSEVNRLALQSSPCDSSSSDFLESAPVGPQQHAGQVQLNIRHGSACATTALGDGTQSQVLWGAADTEGMETLEASDACEFLHPSRALPQQRDTRGQAARNQLLCQSSELFVRGPCVMDFTSDDAETSDASNESEFLSARSNYAITRSRMGREQEGERTVGVSEEAGRGLPSANVVWENLVSAWEFTRSQWKSQRQSGKRGRAEEKLCEELF